MILYGFYGLEIHIFHGERRYVGQWLMVVFEWGMDLVGWLMVWDLDGGCGGVWVVEKGREGEGWMWWCLLWWGGWGESIMGSGVKLIVRT